ncbi:hypothetical protein FBUS_06863 [Fasciolopsis buskii]|uniref:Protein quiver n=1 Tax=Fasciolopsis buskii TaxID=27845 RepID=A0A8E0RLE7_9TREM|nr:hypothetical protein FBUS_06863 [Fasciolopsis buski]
MEIDTNDGVGQTYVQIDMNRRQCLDDPEKFFKPCLLDKDNSPRGCAKLITYSELHSSKDTTYKVTLVRRFCASEGSEPEEQQCRFSPTIDGYSTICICGDNNCNHAPKPTTMMISTVFAVLPIAWFSL